MLAINLAEKEDKQASGKVLTEPGTIIYIDQRAVDPFYAEIMDKVF
jgi:hypothetical protein